MRIPIRVPIKPHPELKGRPLPHPEVIEAQLIDTEEEVRRLRAALVDILANEAAYNRGDGLSAHIAKNALGLPV